MRRLGIFALVMLTAVLLQTTVFAKATLFGVAPDVVLAVVICLGLLEGPVTGAVSGFAGGLLRDLLLDAPKGLTGLAYLLVGYIIGSVRPYVQSTSVFVPVAGVFVGSLAGTALYEVLQGLLGQHTVPLGRAVRVVALTAAYNTLLVPFIYPLVRRLTTLYRAERVYRW